MFKKIKSLIKSLKERKKSGLKGFVIRSIIFLGLTFALNFLIPIYKDYLKQTIIQTNSGYVSFMAIFVISLFLITKKEKISKSYAYNNKIGQTIIFAVLAILAFSIPSAALEYGFHLHQIVSYYLLCGLGIFFTFLAVFNWNFPMKYMQEESLIVMLILIVSLSIPLIFSNLWEFFFIPIKYGTKGLISIFTNNYVIQNNADGLYQGFYIELANFKAIVGPSCSGIYSLIAFSFLFIASLLFLHKGRKINTKKAFSIYIIGAITLYILNILRITILMYVGAYISEDLAINLFHEYLSSIFLMSIFLIYLYKFIPKIFEE